VESSVYEGAVMDCIGKGIGDWAQDELVERG